MTSDKRYLQFYNKNFQLTPYFLSFEDVETANPASRVRIFTATITTSYISNKIREVTLAIKKSLLKTYLKHLTVISSVYTVENITVYFSQALSVSFFLDKY